MIRMRGKVSDQKDGELIRYQDGLVHECNEWLLLTRMIEALSARIVEKLRIT